MTASIGFIIGGAFIFFLTRESLDAPGGVLYLIYGGFGAVTAVAAHWIAFGIKPLGKNEEKA